MNYSTLLNKIEAYEKKYNVVTIGFTKFNRKIMAVEIKNNKNFSTAILVASVHARENITTDLLCKMLDLGLFDNIKNFNVSLVLMANPDGVELSCFGLSSASENEREKLLEINGNNLDFSLWKANGRGVDINNNFDANFGTNVFQTKFSPSGFIGEFVESELETKALVDYTKRISPFFSISFHSKGEEIYYNFFQTGKNLERDRIIAEKFNSSTGYIIKNVEMTSSGGYKDYCISKLKIPALTIEVGGEELLHPIKEEFLEQIFQKHKNIANDLIFAYDIFERFKSIQN